MKAEPLLLGKVLGPDVRLLVPLFQRPYVWNEIDQWKPLWDDVVTTWHRQRSGTDTPHFLGAVVLQQRPSRTGSLELREVIDGQQRLTTLQLLIAAVADVIEDRGANEREVRRLRTLVFNSPDEIDGADEKFKLWPTNRDREAYRVALSRPWPSERSESSSPILHAHRWFHTEVGHWVDDMPVEEREEALVGLAEVLRTGLELVVIDLSVDDNAQVIFETLNARGTALQPSDLVKNLLFRTLQDAGAPVEALYRSHWRPLEDVYWSEEVRQGRLKRPRLDSFMGFFLVILTMQEVLSQNVFPAARSYVSGDAMRAEAFLEELARYARVYRDIENKTSMSDVERAALARLEIVDTQTHRPVLLWLFAHAEGTDRHKALLALDSYLVRRTLCRMTMANYNRMFLELLRRLRDNHSAGNAAAHEVVETFLAGQEAASTVWPSDGDVRKAFGDFNLYTMLRREQLRRVLLVLEQESSTAKNEPLSTSAKLSVEHLLPQSWQAHWPLPGIQHEAEEEGQRSALLHTIGNLTLVTGSLNSALKNAPWTKKREELLAHSAFNLNRGLPSVWDEGKIRERSQHLADVAIRCWGRPVGAPSIVSEWVPDRALATEESHEVPAPPSRSGVPGTRGDIGAHIRHALAPHPPGTFMTIAEIRKSSSPFYINRFPSSGAISARLFPSDGRVVNLDGARPAVQDGKKGAVRN